MNLIKRKRFIPLIILFSLLFLPTLLWANSNFTVVIDAGHGGKDPGTIGRKISEKKITLAVALKLGSLIEKNMPDVKVIYTRKSDTYLTLQERADITNKNKANLFISIHVNSAKSKSASGAETYTFGLSKSKSNLDVAMRENSVILLEEDYTTTYQGFDPNSTESYIMFEFLQDKFYDKSIHFASKVQKSMIHHCKRKDRGVRQEPFWVLHRSACPSILIELGFVSNWEEEQYLSAPKNQQELANAIYKAFVDYKKDYEKKTNIAQLKTNNGKTEVKVADKVEKQNNKKKNEDSKLNNKNLPVYKIQIMASKTKLKENDPAFKGLKNIDYYVENGVYKYTTGSSTNYNSIQKERATVQQKFNGAFVVKFVNGKRVKNN